MVNLKGVRFSQGSSYYCQFILDDESHVVKAQYSVTSVFPSLECKTPVMSSAGVADFLIFVG